MKTNRKIDETLKKPLIRGGLICLLVLIYLIGVKYVELNIMGNFSTCYDVMAKKWKKHHLTPHSLLIYNIIMESKNNLDNIN
jgi:hypothetical protein